MTKEPTINYVLGGRIDSRVGRLARPRTPESEEAVALLNARYELAFTLFGQEANKQATKADLLEVGPDGCTTFGLLPEATADRHT